MHYKKYIIASAISFIMATSPFWLPALLYALGASDGIINWSLGLAGASELFTTLGIGLLILSIYHYRLKRIS